MLLHYEELNKVDADEEMTKTRKHMTFRPYHLQFLPLQTTTQIIEVNVTEATVRECSMLDVYPEILPRRHYHNITNLCQAENTKSALLTYQKIPDFNSDIELDRLGHVNTFLNTKCSCLSFD